MWVSGKVKDWMLAIRKNLKENVIRKKLLINMTRKRLVVVLLKKV